VGDVGVASLAVFPLNGRRDGPPLLAYNRLRDAEPISRPGNEIATNWVKREP
jgi:hypothetical protein